MTFETLFHSNESYQRFNMINWELRTQDGIMNK